MVPNPALNLAPFSRWTLRDKAAQLRRLGCRLFATQHLYGNIGLTIKLLTKPTRLSVPLDFKPQLTHR
jgi:hypothetical protein